MKKNVFVMFLILILFVSACSNNGTKGKQSEEEKEEERIASSTKGIVFSYLNPVVEGVKGSMIESAFKLENYGPNPTTVIIQGSVNPSKLSFNGGGSYIRKTITLNKKTPENENAPAKIVPFGLKVVSNTNVEEADFDVKMCYDYVGEESVEVCIDQDPGNLGLFTKDCTTQPTISISGGQGGPIAISKIEHTNLIDSSNNIKPQFKLYISNMGPGEPVTYGKSATACSGTPLNENDLNAVMLKEISFSNFNKNNFRCTPNPLILGENDKDFIECTLNAGLLKKSKGKTITTPLYIKIGYGYVREDMSRTVKII